jgi:hypothetical protein
MIQKNMVQIIKTKIKEDNKHLRNRNDELLKIIENKDKELTEMQSKYNQIIELNKNAIQRIENLERKANNVENMIEEDEKEEKDLDSEDDDYSSNLITNLKNALKNRLKLGNIKMYSQLVNRKKVDSYTCTKCNEKIIGEEEILKHIQNNHIYNCTIYNTDEYKCNHKYHDSNAEWIEHKNLMHQQKL